MNLFAISIVKTYQWVLSPLLHSAVPVKTGCRFHPSCSVYLIEALRTHGTLTGIRLGMSRMGQCHPFNPMTAIKKI